MHKILTIAVREYRAIVGTKAFLIALMIMPVLMFGGIAVQRMLEGRVGPVQKRIVVLDGTSVLFEKLLEAAEARNEKDIFDAATHKQVKPRYELQAGPPGPVSEATRLELSERVRRREIDSFVEIPADVFKAPAEGTPAKVIFRAENAALADEKNWLQLVINGAVHTRRLQEAGLDPKVVERASTPALVESASLVEQRASGEITRPKERSVQQMIFLPMGTMMLMWMVIFLAAQPMLESVMEEKTQRIAEVLLGSANPFQLMLGKLLGGVGGSLTVVAAYGGGAYALACYYGIGDLMPLRVVPWFIIYQVLAVLMFGSIFMAIGSAVNQYKEAQGMLLPVWLLVMYPLFLWLQVVREPTGDFATWLSLVPPGSPLMMVLRIAATSAVPLWQPLVGIVLMVAATLLVVAAAGKIFRIGMLAQGKTPTIAELIRWVVRA